MGRVIPSENANHHEYLLIELKRPSLEVSRKEVDQLEDYVNAILAQPDFINTSTQWHFFLVTTKYDDVVRERITQEKRPTGLFIDKPNHKVWIKSWSELIRECDTRLKFVQEKLRIEVSADEIQERIARLRTSVLKSNAQSSLDEQRPGELPLGENKLTSSSKDSNLQPNLDS